MSPAAPGRSALIRVAAPKPSRQSNREGTQVKCTARSIFRLPYRAGNQAIRGHPCRIPGFHRCSANRAFEAADLAARNHRFRAIVDRAAGARSMVRIRHVRLCAHSIAIATIKIARCLPPTNDAATALPAWDIPLHEKAERSLRQR